MKKEEIIESILIQGEKIETQKRYCGACMEDPCMCSDPEQTSTTWD